MNRISHWIDGQVVESTSGRSAAVFNPATGEQSAAVDLASVAEVDSRIGRRGRRRGRRGQGGVSGMALVVVVEARRGDVPPA